MPTKQHQPATSPYPFAANRTWNAQTGAKPVSADADRIRSLTAQNQRKLGMNYDEAYRAAVEEVAAERLVTANAGSRYDELVKGGVCVNGATVKERGDAFRALVRKRMRDLDESYDEAFKWTLRDPRNAFLAEAMKQPDDVQRAEREQQERARQEADRFRTS